MSIIGYKRVIIALTIALALSLGCIWRLNWQLFKLRIEVKDTWNTTADCEYVRQTLPDMEIDRTVELLATYAQKKPNYDNEYLDLINKAGNQRMKGDLIEHLRKRTGESLGDDPEVWIKKFGAKYDLNKTN